MLDNWSNLLSYYLDCLRADDGVEAHGRFADLGTTWLTLSDGYPCWVQVGVGQKDTDVQPLLLVDVARGWAVKRLWAQEIRDELPRCVRELQDRMTGTEAPRQGSHRELAKAKATDDQRKTATGDRS